MLERRDFVFGVKVAFALGTLFTVWRPMSLLVSILIRETKAMRSVAEKFLRPMLAA